MNVDNITKGKIVFKGQNVYADFNGEKAGLAVAYSPETIHSVRKYDPQNLNEEANNNAELICEAFNVANETGLSPRELLEQRDELGLALHNAINRLEWVVRYLGAEHATEIENLTTGINRLKLTLNSSTNKTK